MSTIEIPESAVRPAAGGVRDDLIVIEGLRIERGRGDDAFVVEIPELRIERGSFTSILGPSGCGKTSLLLVLGLLRVAGEDPEFRISCGEMRFRLRAPLPGFDGDTVTIYRGVVGGHGGERLAGERVETLRQRLIGFCLQGGELVPSLTLEENVAVPACLGGFREARARAAERLRGLAMEERRTVLPSQLSGGQNQRGILARALVHDPPLILLDEPTSALDRHTAESAIELLRRRAQTHAQTVIMVTHDEALARRFSDAVAVMDSVGPRRGGLASLDSGSRPPAPAAAEDDAPGPATADPPAVPGRLSRIAYYLRLAWLDAVGPLAGALGSVVRGRRRRLWGDGSLLRRGSTYAFVGQLVKNSLIAVAIGLLILLLRGVRSGMIEEFRQSLVRSPTARELTITPMGATGALGAAAIEELKRRYPEIDLVLPQSTHVVSLENPPVDDSSLTLVGTLPEDPKLAALYADQDFSTFGPDALVISTALADGLGVGVGEQISVWVTRALDADGKRRETSPAALRVSHVLEGGDKKTAYAHLELMRRIADYKAGRPVPEHDWPGFARAVVPRYAAFLMFAKRPLSGREQGALTSRGLVAEALEADDPRATLHARLRDAAEIEAAGKPGLHAYAARSGLQQGDLKWLDPALAAQVGRLMIDSDAVLLPWNEPRAASLDGEEIRLVGLSGSVRWLKSYLRHPGGVFPRTENGWHLSLGDRGEDPRPATLEAELGGERLALPVDLHGPAADAERPDVAVVPAALLAHLHMADDGLAVADLDQRLFRPVSDEVVYYQARVFVRDAFQVADLHERLAERFGVRSNQARVREVQRYSQVLDLLVQVLSAMALGIALATVYVVFHDVTLRKKRMIGTLRILGLPRHGVVLLLLVRGLLVAAVASGLIYAVGRLAGAGLNAYHGQTLCLLSPYDYLGVASGIVAICLLAVLAPAWRVSRLDPVAALEEAKLNA